MPDALVPVDPATQDFQSWPIRSGAIDDGIVRHMRPTKDGNLLIHQSSTKRIILVTVNGAAARIAGVRRVRRTARGWNRRRKAAFAAQPGLGEAEMSRILLLGALLALIATSGAAAKCVEAVTEVEGRIVASDGDHQRVELRTGTTRVDVEQPVGGTTPTESWGGASSGFPAASAKLRDARRMAQDGDEDGCLILVEEARLMLQGLVR